MHPHRFDSNVYIKKARAKIRRSWNVALCRGQSDKLYLPCWLERNRNVEDVRCQLFYYLYNSSGKAGAKILIQYTQIHSGLYTQRCKIWALKHCWTISNIVILDVSALANRKEFISSLQLQTPHSVSVPLFTNSTFHSYRLKMQF